MFHRDVGRGRTKKEVKLYVVFLGRDGIKLLPSLCLYDTLAILMMQHMTIWTVGSNTTYKAIPSGSGTAAILVRHVFVVRIDHDIKIFTE